MHSARLSSRVCLAVCFELRRTAAQRPTSPVASRILLLQHAICIWQHTVCLNCLQGMCDDRLALSSQSLALVNYSSTVLFMSQNLLVIC